MHIYLKQKISSKYSHLPNPTLWSDRLYLRCKHPLWGCLLRYIYTLRDDFKPVDPSFNVLHTSKISKFLHCLHGPTSLWKAALVTSRASNHSIQLYVRDLNTRYTTTSILLLAAVVVWETNWHVDLFKSVTYNCMQWLEALLFTLKRFFIYGNMNCKI